MEIIHEGYDIIEPEPQEPSGLELAPIVKCPECREKAYVEGNLDFLDDTMVSLSCGHVCFEHELL